ncbi:GNAT family N-acetyltransferase [Halomonas rhizosphaerae]|uniref:BioF2-like acetyltransferase domain-containing protein n=1 Tax=Halomonas rhizosphaerae TaxID=3043296 RepID=A0ABT6V3Q7_9GAMM|nr:GNAT family N-acetyltransferase [Halomonas rhizosphaerae]MDI5891874.1 hypothetical protein [Halomonas rhizosphaerae]
MTMGYLHPLYAESFKEFGDPHALKHSGGWALERAIPNTDRYDAMGLYPLFCCSNWSELHRDLEAQRGRWVSIALVTDPFGDYDQVMLEKTFDVVMPYKDHYVADTSVPLEKFVSKSHRSNARRALRKLDVEVCTNPASYVDDWIKLYGVLAQKHDIQGLTAFSRSAFEKQLQVPGMVMFRAVHNGETVGLDLWYVQNDVAQGHLVAFNDQGYALSASYATKWTMLNYFSDKVRWINLGGLPGTGEESSSGLGHFKSGWANTTRKVYFCGRILDRQAYDSLIKGSSRTTFFPAYRVGVANEQ